MKKLPFACVKSTFDSGVLIEADNNLFVNVSSGTSVVGWILLFSQSSVSSFSFTLSAKEVIVPSSTSSCAASKLESLLTSSV